MNKLLVGIALAVSALSAQGQNPVIRGEQSAGVYKNFVVTAAGSMAINLANENSSGSNADGDAGNWSGSSISLNKLFNGASWDRARSMSIGDGAAATGIAAEGTMLFNGATYDRWRSSSGGTVTGTAIVTTNGRDPCISSDVAKVSAAINITTATTVQLVAPNASTVVYVCAFTMTISQVVTTANTLKFVRGTGATCGTGSADMTGTYGAGGVTAAAPIVVTSGVGSTIFKTNAADGLCVTTTIGGSASFQGLLTYVQQ